MKSLAQINFSPPGGSFSGFGPLGTNVGTGIVQFSNVISTTIGVMSIVAFIWFTFNLITGAIGIMIAGGDKQALENARKKITYGLIGLIIVIAAVFIIDLIGTIFGIPFLNLQKLFSTVTGSSSTGGEF